MSSEVDDAPAARSDSAGCLLLSGVLFCVVLFGVMTTQCVGSDARLRDAAIWDARVRATEVAEERRALAGLHWIAASLAAAPARDRSRFGADFDALVAATKAHCDRFNALVAPIMSDAHNASMQSALHCNPEQDIAESAARLVRAPAAPEAPAASDAMEAAIQATIPWAYHADIDPRDAVWIRDVMAAAPEAARTPLWRGGAEAKVARRDAQTALAFADQALARARRDRDEARAALLARMTPLVRPENAAMVAPFLDGIGAAVAAVLAAEPPGGVGEAWSAALAHGAPAPADLFTPAPFAAALPRGGVEVATFRDAVEGGHRLSSRALAEQLTDLGASPIEAATPRSVELATAHDALVRSREDSAYSSGGGHHFFAVGGRSRGRFHPHGR